MRNKLKITLVIICTLLLSFSLSISAQTATVQPQKLTVHYLDVGQADSILIQTPSGKSMLIDAGNNEDSNTILSYVKKLKIKTIDVLIGTHPHEDHIGSMDDVIKTFSIGKIYMPKASTTTKTFKDLLTSIKNKGLKVTTAAAGLNINDLDPLLKISMLAPNNSTYEDLNNYSAVIKIVYGTTSFLFTGDAEDISEKEMIDKKYNLKANVLKVGHHGSKYSTSAAFLKAVSPQYAVISVGKDNDYGHPAQATIDRLNASKIQIYRTDLLGTIIETSDGKNITLNKNATVIKPQAPPSDTIVYITKTGEKYHKDGCRYLAKSKISIKLKDAKSRGYTPCSICKPPQ